MQFNVNNAYSYRSKAELARVCPELVAVLEEVLPFVDHSVLCGARTAEEQNKLYEEKATKVQYPNSKHNVGEEAGRELSDAADIAVYHHVFGKLIGTHLQYCEIQKHFGISRTEAELFLYMEYCKLATLVDYCAYLKGVAIRWGGDWNGINGTADQDFDDLFHFEVVR